MKNKNPKILFIEPYCIGNNNFSMPGIAYLRGFLKDKDIQSDVIDFNKILKNNKKTIDLNCINYLNKYINKNKSFLNNKKKDDFKIINDFFNLEQNIIFEAIDKNNIFQKLFQKQLSQLSKYRYIGLSATLDIHLLFTLILAKFIKKNINNIKIILGGPLVTSFYKDIVSLQKNNPTIDYLVIGEGETPVWKIINQSQLDEVPNLIYLENGSYKKSQNMNHAEDIMKLPAPIFNDDDTIIYLQATRKCYWGKCAYCTFDKNKFVKNLLVKNPKKIIEYISTINFIKNKAKYFIFTDNALPINFLQNFSQEIIKNKLNYNFEAYLRAEKTLNYEILHLAKKAGFNRFKLGIETFNPRLSKLLNRGTDTEKIPEIIKICSDLRIDINLYFMIGLPTQTKKELKKDFDCMLSVTKKYSSIIKKMQILLFRLEIDSIIYNNPAQYEIKVLYDQKKHFDRIIPFKQLRKNAISSEEALEMHKKFYKKNEYILKNIYGSKPFFWKDNFVIKT